jgi:hypothetical protein
MRAAPARGSRAAPGVEVLGRQIGCDDVRPGLGSADGRVAGSGGDVEDVLAGAYAARLHELRPDLPHGAFANLW